VPHMRSAATNQLTSIPLLVRLRRVLCLMRSSATNYLTLIPLPVRLRRVLCLMRSATTNQLTLIPLSVRLQGVLCLMRSATPKQLTLIRSHELAGPRRRSDRHHRSGGPAQQQVPQEADQAWGLREKGSVGANRRESSHVSTSPTHGRTLS
jgi:hypothetical protein